MDALDVRHLLGPRAVVVHVAHEGRAELLAGALPAIGAAVQHVARDRRRGAHAGAADAHLGVAVHGAEDDDGLAHAGFDHADRHADQRLGGGAAAEHVHVEIEPDAEVAGDEGREGGIAGLVGEHAVDVAGLQPGVDDGIAHRPGAERPCRPAGAARVGRSRRRRRWRTCREDISGLSYLFWPALHGVLHACLATPHTTRSRGLRLACRAYSRHCSRQSADRQIQSRRRRRAARGVARKYEIGTLAVTGVDLDLRAGEFVSLLGPSGCGKSTLLRLIAGLGEPSAGHIDWPTSARDVGFGVFQDATLMPWATALQNVVLPLWFTQMPTNEAASTGRGGPDGGRPARPSATPIRASSRAA